MWTATSGHATGALHSPISAGVAATAAREPWSCDEGGGDASVANAARCHDGIRRRRRWV